MPSQRLVSGPGRATVGALVFCAAVLGCDRDLAVPIPPAVSPPKVTAASPNSGFAGEVIQLQGAALGDRSTRVSFDGISAVVLDAAGGDAGVESLAVRVPVLPDDGVHAVKVRIDVTTAVGTTALADFVFLGSGHPQQFQVIGTQDVAPQFAQVLDVGGATVLRDTRYGAFVPQEGVSGGLGAALRDAPPSYAVLAALGDRDGGVLFADSLTTYLPDGGTLPQVELIHSSGAGTLDGGARFTPPDTLSPTAGLSSWSPAGTAFLTAGTAQTPTRILSVDLGAHAARSYDGQPPTSGMVWLQLTSDTRALGLGSSGLFSMDVGTGAAVLAVLPDDAAAPTSPPAMALAPDGHSMTYVRKDGWSLGTLDLNSSPPRASGAVGAPLLDHVDELVWSKDGSRLLVADRAAGRVTCLDASLAPIGSVAVDQPHGMIALGAGPVAQPFALVSGGSTSLLLGGAACQVFRSTLVRSEAWSGGVDPAAGHFIVNGRFGSLQGSPAFGLGLIGPWPVVSSPGGAIGIPEWGLQKVNCADTVFGCTFATYNPFDSRTSQGRVVAGALSDDALTAALLTTSSSGLSLEVFDLGGVKPGPTSVVTVEGPGAQASGVVFLQGTPYFAWNDKAGLGWVGKLDSSGAVQKAQICSAHLDCQALSLVANPRSAQLVVNTALFSTQAFGQFYDTSLTALDTALFGGGLAHFLAAGPDGTLLSVAGTELRLQSLSAPNKEGVRTYTLLHKLTLPEAPTAAAFAPTGRQVFVVLAGSDQVVTIE